MRKLRVGVIGAGSWAVAAHLPALRTRAEDVDVVALCRPDAESASRIARRFDIPLAATDYREVLAQECDIVVVSSPGSLHHEHAAAALRAGAHVLCEKPMTLSSDDAWDLVRLARNVDRELLVSFGWNFMPIVDRARDLVRDHGLGELEQLAISMSSQARELLLGTGSYPDADPESVPQQRTWTDPGLSGGGYGQAQLSHALGLAFALTSERVHEVFAWMMVPAGAVVELHDALSLRFDNGAVGTVAGGAAHLGANGNKHQLEVRMIGSRGQLLVDVDREAVVLFSGSKEHRADVQAGDGSYDLSGPAIALVDVALGRRPNDQAPGEIGARTVDVLEAAYRSAIAGTPQSCDGRTEER